jgi:spore coat protein H
MLIFKRTRVVVAALAWGMQVGLAAQAGGGAEARRAASDELFTNAEIRHLRIELPEAGLATLRAYRWHKGEPPEARPTVSCTVREGATVYTNVGVHLKGGYGSFRSVDSKPGLTLAFDKSVKQQRFHGLGKISLNNSAQDPSYISDKLCREMYTQAGVPVPRADYATAELNGRPLGLYVLTEGWDKQFLKRHFANVDGNLYDPVVSTDIDRRLRATSGENREDQSALRMVALATRGEDPVTRLAQLERLVDLDRFFTLLALQVMFWDWDGYAMNRNNYRVFHDLETRRLVFMPHGMDQMFWRPDGPIVTGRNGCVARAVLDSAEGRRRYLERFTQLRTNVFDLARVTARVDELAARLRPALSRNGGPGLPSLAAHARAVSVLRSRILQRGRNVDDQLAGVGHRTAQELNQPVLLTNWSRRIQAGQPRLDLATEPDLLHLAATPGSIGAWLTTVWLEEGNYRIEGRVKTRAIQAGAGDPLAGAGLRVWSNRKITEGLQWSWFPYRESGDRLRRGEVVAPDFVPQRFTGSRDWTDVTYEIELRQPIADLEVRCELEADAGEAWFDLSSLRITRLTDATP